MLFILDFRLFLFFWDVIVLNVLQNFESVVLVYVKPASPACLWAGFER